MPRQNYTGRRGCAGARRQRSTRCAAGTANGKLRYDTRRALTAGASGPRRRDRAACEPAPPGIAPETLLSARNRFAWCRDLGPRSTGVMAIVEIEAPGAALGSSRRSPATRSRNRPGAGRSPATTVEGDVGDGRTVSAGTAALPAGSAGSIARDGRRLRRRRRAGPDRGCADREERPRGDRRVASGRAALPQSHSSTACRARPAVEGFGAIAIAKGLGADEIAAGALLMGSYSSRSEPGEWSTGPAPSRKRCSRRPAHRRDYCS